MILHSPSPLQLFLNRMTTLAGWIWGKGVLVGNGFPELMLKLTGYE